MDLNLQSVGRKFIVAVPIRNTPAETAEVLDGYAQFSPGGFMVGVGGRLPAYSSEPSVLDVAACTGLIRKLRDENSQAIIAVDAEGGGIFNILQNISPLASPRSYGADGSAGLRRMQQDLQIHAAMLGDMGVTMNFAPLLDIPMPGYRGYTATDQRCYSDDPQLVSDFAAEFIRIHREHGITCTAKHFPGYGHLTVNPHSSLSDEWNRWEAQRHLLPYRRLQDAGLLDAVMKGHSTTGLNTEVPATLSHRVEELLRADLGFTGISVADELYMGAVNDFYRTAVSGRTDGDPDGRSRAIDAWKLNDYCIVSYPIQNTDGTVTGVPGGEERLGRMVRAVAEDLAAESD